ncbi:MAG: hypothetical protein IPG81_28325 [Sandaracinaceae bacterium]|nr:hypothetical protein [Sandaracinaceae bacterium]
MTTARALADALGLRAVWRAARVVGVLLVVGCEAGDAPADRAPVPSSDGPTMPTAEAAPHAEAPGEPDAGDIPLGEAPPPPGTHFVDIAAATTRRGPSFSEFEYRIPEGDWPPSAHRHEGGMRVRWWINHSCGPGVQPRVELQEGVLILSAHFGVPRHCGNELTEYVTTLPAGNTAVHSLRDLGGHLHALPDVLPDDRARRPAATRMDLPW